MGINTNEDSWNGKPDWLEEVVEKFQEHHFDTPDILSGHDAGTIKPETFEGGAVCIENLDDGQGSIIKELASNGFVVQEIHDHGFYIGKLKEGN